MHYRKTCCTQVWKESGNVSKSPPKLDMSCTYKKVLNMYKIMHTSNLIKGIHCMKIYCTQIWCSLLTHVNIIMSWFWKGGHFRNGSDKAMCLVKLGFITSCVNASMNHFDRSTTCGSLWETNKWRGWESTQFFLRKRLLFCFVQTLQPEGWICQVFIG